MEVRASLSGMFSATCSSVSTVTKRNLKTKLQIYTEPAIGYSFCCAFVPIVHSFSVNLKSIVRALVGRLSVCQIY